ncbi:MAG: hypothetical protein LBD59_00190 [Prevotellaceae bacterium]|nr:hypothetical protein [Prevotellaceae bacterium]
MKNFVNETPVAIDISWRNPKKPTNAGIRTKSLESLSINTTDLYVRLLPQDSAGYEALRQDSTLELFDYPLDYEIVQTGDYYNDPDLANNTYTWLYAVVKPAYQPPQGVIYEILEELFIIENSEGYSEEAIQTKSNGSTRTALIDDNLQKALVATSFVLTDNGGELRTDDTDTPQTKKTYTNCFKRCILWGRICWTYCDSKHYPDGYIRVNTPSGNIGLKGVKVRTSRWFHTITMRTNDIGYYSSQKDYYDDILVGNTSHYEVIFEGVNGSNSWAFNRTIAGAVCTKTASYGAGRHSPSGHSFTYYTNSDYWGKAVLNNAIYDYIDYAKRDGISLPPNTLDIANKQTNDLRSSAPLLKNHTDLALVYASPLWGTLATILGYKLFGGSFPDLILNYNKTLSDYNRIPAVGWHEMTHASQLQRMKSEKGYYWASDYWSNIVLREASNSVNTGSSYGQRGGDGWQIIALTEGWAYYREWDLARRFLSWNSITQVAWTSTSLMPVRGNYTLVFPRNYIPMFYELATAGCSHINIEKSLCTYNIPGFRDNLIAKYPNRRDRITEIIQPYE